MMNIPWNTRLEISFLVDSTWYGGVNVTSKSGIPLSLDKEEYEFVNRDEAVHAIDAYSYGLGAMDCFCEMVSAGLKTLAMSHPCDTREERDSYLQDAEKLCRKYGVKLYPEDEAFITDLFPEELNKGKYNYLFYRTGDVLERYMGLKEQQKRLIADHAYTGQERYRIAVEFGKLLSYPEDGIERLIERAGREKHENPGSLERIIVIAGILVVLFLTLVTSSITRISFKSGGEGRRGGWKRIPLPLCHDCGGL